jgi:hypothetical protein
VVAANRRPHHQREDNARGKLLRTAANGNALRHSDDVCCGAGISVQAVRRGVEAVLADEVPRGAVIAGYAGQPMAA